MKKFLFTTLFAISSFAGHVVIERSHHTFDVTFHRAMNAIKSKHLKIFAIIDHQKNAQKIAQHLQPARLILFGRAQLGTKILKQDPAAGLDLPLRIYIYENEGHVFCSYHDPLEMREYYYVHSKRLIHKMEAVLRSIVNYATGR